MRRPHASHTSGGPKVNLLFRLFPPIRRELRAGISRIATPSRLPCNLHAAHPRHERYPEVTNCALCHSSNSHENAEN